MLSSLDKLTAEEKHLVMNALPVITVLIAAADGKVDESETGWASKLTDMRSYSHEEELQEYYEAISVNFDQEVRMLVKDLPANTKEAIPALSAVLAGMNEVLPKLPPQLAAIFLKSMKTFAKHIARASGGFLRMASISKEEQALINLPMITFVPEEIVEDTEEETTD